MDSFQFLMPTQLFFGKNCVSKQKQALIQLGKKAMIVTGKHSSKINGSFADITKCLEVINIVWVLYDEIEENPTLETVVKGSHLAQMEQIDFVIGVGGGSSMDAAKAIACLGKNNTLSPKEVLYTDTTFSHWPVVAIPTTAGTGSETTQFSILTLHEKQTKECIAPPIFATVAYLDARYLETLSKKVTTQTAIDALCHLIEGYTTVDANFLSDRFAEIGFTLFKESIPALLAGCFPLLIREKLLLMSTIAGITIAQSGTSLPHALGLPLTYEKNISHGQASGLFLRRYLEILPIQDKVKHLLSLLGFSSAADLGVFLQFFLEEPFSISKEELEIYAKRTFTQKGELVGYGYPLTEAFLLQLYCDSLLPTMD